MGSVRKHRSKWQGRYRGPDGKLRARSFDRKIDAERWAKSEEVAQLSGEWIDPRTSRITFAIWIETWRTTKRHRPSTRDQVDSHLRNHIIPKWGERRLASIRKSEVQAWVLELGELLAPATVETVYAHFRSAIRAAVEDRVLASDPSRGVRAPKPSKRAIIPLDDEEAAAVVRAAPTELRALVVLALGTGMRQGEVFAATNDPAVSIDWTRRRITVERQIVQTSEFHGFGPVKTAAGNRKIPLADGVLEVLSEHCRASEVGHGELLFRTRTGAPQRRSSFSSKWRRVIGDSGLDREVRFHDLRHTYASALIRDGINPKLIQTLMGHATVAETFDTYGHLFPGDEDLARQVVAKASARWLSRGPYVAHAELA